VFIKDFEYDIEMVKLSDNKTDYDKKLTPENIELAKKPHGCFEKHKAMQNFRIVYYVKKSVQVFVIPILFRDLLFPELQKME